MNGWLPAKPHWKKVSEWLPFFSFRPVPSYNVIQEARRWWDRRHLTGCVVLKLMPGNIRHWLEPYRSQDARHIIMYNRGQRGGGKHSFDRCARRQGELPPESHQISYLPLFFNCSCHGSLGRLMTRTMLIGMGWKVMKNGCFPYQFQRHFLLPASSSVPDFCARN